MDLLSVVKEDSLKHGCTGICERCQVCASLIKLENKALDGRITN